MSNKEDTAKYKRTMKGVLTTLYAGSVQKSKRRGHAAPSYTSEEFLNKYLTDITFLHIYQNWAIEGFHTMLKPSIDRLDNTKPYTWDNIQLVDWKTNLYNHNKLSNPPNQKRSVIQLDPITGEEIMTYESIQQANRILGVNKSHVTSVCRGKRKTTGGFKWAYNNV